MKKYNLVSNGPVGGDCTAPYIVRFYGQMTVGEFVQSVLANEPGEWGYIGIYDGKSIFGDPCCSYKYGELVSKLPENVMDKVILSANASGGWSRMDYILKIE